MVYLILLLRWCREHTELRQKIFSIPSKSLQVIVDYSIILLGTAISHYYLLGTPDIVTKDIDKHINEQILKMFDQVNLSQNLNLLSSELNNVRSGQGVRSFIGDDI